MAGSQRRTFKIARDAKADVGQVFDLEWESADGADAGTGGSEEFKAYPGRIPGAVIMDVPNMMVDENTVAYWNVFRHALGDEFDRFSAIIHDPKRLVPAETLSEILSWLFEEATGRPTQPS